MPTAERTPLLLTIGVIATRTGLPVHRVEYLLRTRAFTPAGRAGNARVYDESVVALIEREAAGASARSSSLA